MLRAAPSMFPHPIAGKKIMRSLLVLIHRWAGLSTAVFLTVAGLTGAVLAFHEEVEELLNPQWFVALPPSGDITKPFIDPFLLRQKVEYSYPQAQVQHVSFPRAGKSQMFYLGPRQDPKTGQAQALAVNQVFLNPYTGVVLGAREWGVLFAAGQFHQENIVPFLLKLHMAFALPHPYGQVFMGVVALIWTLDCFAGLALTFPARQPWFWQWRTAWKIKFTASFHRFNFDVHRSLGLWCWFALLLFAWSSVMLNLGEQVYKPVMSSILVFDERPRNSPLLHPLATLIDQPALEWREAYQQAKHALQLASVKHGFSIQAEDSFWYRPAFGAYLYRTRTTLDKSDHGAGTNLWIDGMTGNVLREDYLGHGASGDIVSKWLRALHTGAVFGLAYRVIIVVLGIAVAILSITGAVLWWKKRQSRRLIKMRRKFSHQASLGSVSSTKRN